MRWSKRKMALAATALLCCGLSIAGFSAGPQDSIPPTGPQPAPTATPSPTAPQSTPATDTQRRPEFLVMIDPSHGGNDKGASFGGKLVEKDITLRLARELRKELEER